MIYNYTPYPSYSHKALKQNYIFIKNVSETEDCGELLILMQIWSKLDGI